MKRTNIAIVVIAITIFFVGGGTFAYARYLGPQTVLQTNADKQHCREGNVLDGVERQSRLTVLSTCEKVVGVVHDMSINKGDGGYEFNLDVEQPYKKLLNQANENQWHGMLHTEIIPKDQNSSSVQIPKNGDRVEVYGARVADHAYLGLPFLAGWNEIHPAWNVRILSR
jgi:hypothetical protein